MRFLHVKAFLLFFMFLLFAGCGDGSGDLNGDLSVTASTNGNGSGVSSVSFTVTYINAQVADFQGTPVIINTFVDGSKVDSFTDHFSSSGSVIYTYTGVPENSTITLEARMGSITRSATVSIDAATLSLDQTILNFPLASTLGSQRTASIRGGTAPYSASSSTADLTAIVNGSTLTVLIANQNNTGTAQTATITVTDSSNNTTSVTINY